MGKNWAFNLLLLFSNRLGKIFYILPKARYVMYAAVAPSDRNKAKNTSATGAVVEK